MSYALYQFHWKQIILMWDVFHLRCLYVWKIFLLDIEFGLIFSFIRLKILCHFLLIFMIPERNLLLELLFYLYNICLCCLQELPFIFGYVQFYCEVSMTVIFGFILFWISVLLWICRFIYFTSAEKFSDNF